MEKAKSENIEDLFIVANAIDQSLDMHKRDDFKIFDDIRLNLKNYIIQNIRENHYMAKLAWSWYGIINNDIVNKHGFHTYSESTIFGLPMNGFLQIVLHAGGRIGLRTFVSQSDSIKALKILTKYGYQALPMPKEEKIGTFGIPDNVWTSCFRNLQDDPETFAGCFLGFLMSFSGDQNHTSKYDNRINQITSRMLKRGIMQQLPYFELIEKAAENGCFSERRE